MASDMTTTAILDTAERLFAEKGYDAVSVREITREAGVNVAAIHYHFGSKEEVLRGVTDRVVTAINERRIELLAELLATTGEPSVEQVLEAFVRPDIEMLQALHERGPTVARFLGRMYLDQTPWIQEMAATQFGTASAAFFPVIARAVGDFDEEIVAIRMRRIGVVIAHTFATWPTDGLSEQAAVELLGELVSFCAAAVSAPMAMPVDS
jgi:AcrR family transcriptional regulator